MRSAGGCLPLVFLCKQSMPRNGLFSLTCLALTSVMVWMGFSPLFSARAIGITSKASAKALMAYCSNDGHWKGNWHMSMRVEQEHNHVYRKRWGQKVSDAISLTLSAAWLTARAHAISEAPPPYTTLLSLTKLRITHRASWRARLASSMIYQER